MIDFHAHILPQMDDGPDNMSASLAMLRQSFRQGVDCVVSTSHFYADEEYPRDFLQRRNHTFQLLQDAMLMSPAVYPRIILGAEVLYFPGIHEAEEIASLMIGDSKTILIEPPMAPWSDEMLDDISRFGENFGCTPVIAHVDRYMRMLRDKTLINRVRERNMLVQVNAEYFLNPKSVREAIQNLKKGKIQMIGSDCHNLDSRAPNLGQARNQARAFGAASEFKMLHRYAEELLNGKGE